MTVEDVNVFAHCYSCRLARDFEELKVLSSCCD